MATPRRSFRLACLALTALGVLGVLPAVSTAQSVGDARQELEALNARSDAAVEDYAEARIALTKAERRAASAGAKVTRAEAQLKAMQAGLGDFISAAYRSGGTNDLVQLVTTSDPQTFLDQAATLDRIARDRSTKILDVRVARRRLTAEQNAASAAVAEARAIEARLSGIKATIEASAGQQQALLSRLESAAARRARLAREADARRAARASRGSRSYYTGPASGRAAVAVREAHAQLGKPYRWGAAGPNSFDCSGLMMWVWGKAGVALPHSSRAQYQYGRHVSKSELRPGDLVFYGHPIHHVGIYVGNGQYIAAPQTGDVVSFRSVNRSNWAGATRL